MSLAQTTPQISTPKTSQRKPSAAAPFAMVEKSLLRRPDLDLYEKAILWAVLAEGRHWCHGWTPPLSLAALAGGVMGETKARETVTALLKRGLLRRRNLGSAGRPRYAYRVMQPSETTPRRVRGKPPKKSLTVEKTEPLKKRAQREVRAPHRALTSRSPANVGRSGGDTAGALRGAPTDPPAQPRYHRKPTAPPPALPLTLLQKIGKAPSQTQKTPVTVEQRKALLAAQSRQLLRNRPSEVQAEGPSSAPIRPPPHGNPPPPKVSGDPAAAALAAHELTLQATGWRPTPRPVDPERMARLRRQRERRSRYGWGDS